MFGFENVNNRLQSVERNVITRILKLFGAHIDENVEIESPIYLNAKTNYDNLHIGRNTYIGKGCFFDLKGRINIGENTVISMQSTLLSHIDLGKNNCLGKIYPPNLSYCKIGNHCYIGARSTVLPSVSIKDFSFIAAGSVVTKNIGPLSLVAGVPAKEIKKISI